jgi:hypothetical protein
MDGAHHRDVIVVHGLGHNFVISDERCGTSLGHIGVSRQGRIEKEFAAVTCNGVARTANVRFRVSFIRRYYTKTSSRSPR